MPLVDLLQRIYNLLSNEVWEDELGYCRVNSSFEEIQEISEEIDGVIGELCKK